MFTTFDDSILKPRTTMDSDDFVRSRSAPPASVTSVWGERNEQKAIALDPKLTHLYQSQRRLNPRLPKPLYTNFVDSKKSSNPWNAAPGAPSILKSVTEERSGSLQEELRTGSPIYSSNHQQNDKSKTSSTSSLENAFSSMRVSRQAVRGAKTQLNVEKLSNAPWKDVASHIIFSYTND